MKRTGGVRNRELPRLRSCAAIAFAFAILCSFAGAATKGQHWVATWSTANSSLANPTALSRYKLSGAPTEFSNQTIRNIVHSTVGGSAIRIRLTNTFGAKAVRFDSVYVGLQESGASLIAGSNHPVTFGGAKLVAIPEGAEAISDPVSLSIGPQKNLVVSLFTSGPTGPATSHSSAFQTNYVSGLGDFAAEEGAGAFKDTMHSWYFLAAVDVLAAREVTGAVVALGDSITDGSSSKPETYGRWTDLLARRLLATNSPGLMSVLNAGIGGNRVLSSSPCFGINALARIERDVFAQSGLRMVILFEGTNDIGQPDTPAAAIPPDMVPCLSRIPITADDLIAGYKQIIAQAHARGLKIIGATIMPYQGFGGWTLEGEAKRVAANHWIKTAGEFDGVIDFDSALADPANPARLAPPYDSGDHLHPGPAGHEAMANAIDLALFH